MKKKKKKDTPEERLEEAYQAFEEIKYYEAKIDQINHQLATRTDYESIEYGELIEQLSDFQHQYEIHGGYNYVGDTEKILLGLGFKREDFDNQTDTFSGGWRMRIELAKLLLQSNDILLLDEPTNHLDEMRKDGFKSPDRADALMMAVFFADKTFDEFMLSNSPQYGNTDMERYPNGLPVYAKTD